MSRRNIQSTLAILLMLLVGGHAFLAAREGLSNVFAHAAFAESSQPALPTTGRAEPPPVLEYLETGLRHSPRNAWALEQMGVQQLRLARQFGQSSDALDTLKALNAGRSAIDRFHQALRERPTSPSLWANLALSKLQLAELDAELAQALRYADLLGPWEPDIQNAVITASLAAWRLLDAEQQQSVVRTMVRGAQRDPVNIANIGKKYNRIDLLCAINNMQLAAAAACNSGISNKRKAANRDG